MRKQFAVRVTLVLAFLFLAVASALQVASANPVVMPMIEVASPVNNQIYPTSEVQLSFTVYRLPAGETLTSFTYSVDGQPRQTTNGTNLLTGLTPGDHTLTIYGNHTNVWNNHVYFTGDVTVQIIHFSSSYSPRWVTFGEIAVAATIASVLAVLFFARHGLNAQLKAKKTAAFWVGLACIVLSALLFVPTVWEITGDYLYPSQLYPSHGIQVSPVFLIPYSAVALGVGVALMVLGAKRRGLPNPS